MKQLRADLAAAKSALRRLEKDFLNRLQAAATALDADSTESLVLNVLHADLRDRLDADTAIGRRALVDRYRTWADKYAITLRALESSRDEAAARLNAYLKDLGYE